MFLIHPIIENGILYRFYIRNLTTNEEYLRKSIPSEIESALVCDIKLFHKLFPHNIPLRLIDINFLSSNSSKIKEDEFILYYHYQYLYPNLSNVYKVLPTIKVLEHFRNHTNKFLELIDLESISLPSGFEFYNDRVSRVFSRLEMEYISINEEYFPRLDLLEDGYLYSNYNIYNKWSRPTNIIDGFNLTSISSKDNVRKSIIPSNNVLLEFDYNSYQINLLASIVGHEFETNDIYSYLKNLYDSKTIEDAKTSTMYYLFSDLEKNPYPNDKFFTKVFDYKKTLTNFVSQSGKQVELQLNGKDLPRILQVVDTEKNVIVLEQLQEYLKDKESRLILYFYDSFVIDFSKKDGKSTILEIKEIVQQNAPCKIKYGKNYQDMELLIL